MANPYPGYGPSRASFEPIEPSWFERLVAALGAPTKEPMFDPTSGQTIPAGASATPALELLGLGGTSRIIGNIRAGHPITDASAPSYMGQYGDALDAVGLAAPATFLGGKGLVKVTKVALENAAKGPTPGSRMAQRGAITAGGDPKVIPSHATDVEKLERAYRSLGGSALYSPSIAFDYDKVNSFVGGLNNGGEVLLIPKIGAFDPSSYTSTLYNRDAYLPRHHQFPGQKNRTGNLLAFDRGLANFRLAGKEGQLTITPEMRLSDDLTSALHGQSHRAALANSPHFRSFAEYERSPAGLQTLIKGRKESASFSAEALLDKYHARAQDIANSHGFSKNYEVGEITQLSDKLLIRGRERRRKAVDTLTGYHPELARDLSQLAAEFRERFSRVPADYAELQPYGLTPLTQDNWAGAFVAGGPKDAERLQRIMGLPIEVFSPGKVKAADIIDFQQQMGLARRQPIGVGLASGARLRLPPVEKKRTVTAKSPAVGTFNSTIMGANKGKKAPVGGFSVKDLLEIQLPPNWTKGFQHLNEAAAQGHLLYGLEQMQIGDQEWKLGVAGALQVMKEKGWTPNPDSMKYLVGWEPEAAASQSLKGIFDDATIQTLSEHIPDWDYIHPTSMPELLAAAGKLNDTPLQQALFEYSMLGPEDTAIATAKHDAALQKVKDAWKAATQSGAKQEGNTLVNGKNADDVPIPDLYDLYDDLPDPGPTGPKKPQTSTGNAALDAEIDAIAQATFSEVKPAEESLVGNHLADALGKDWYEKDVPTVAGSLFDLDPNQWTKGMDTLTKSVWPTLHGEIKAFYEALQAMWPTGVPMSPLKPLKKKAAPNPILATAHSFLDHASDVASGDTTPGENIANFLNLMKEAKINVEKVAPGKYELFTTADPDHIFLLDTLKVAPEHLANSFEYLLSGLLPDVYATMKKIDDGYGFEP